MSEPLPPAGARGDDPLAWPAPERALLPFLPMIYVAWADGVLSGEEIAGIRAQVAARGGLDADCRRRLQEWLDPENPPAPRRLQAIPRTLRQVAPRLAPRARASLADLGLELARLATDPAAGGADPAVVEALADIEASLGVVGREAAGELLAPARPPAAPGPAPAAAFEVAALTALLDAPYAGVRRRLRELLSRPEFAYAYELDRDAYCERVLGWCRELARAGFGALAYPPEHGGAGDYGAFIAAFETLAFHDQSLLVKFGVQFGLFGGSIFQLGTERHHREYLERIGRLELAGCFAMSETGHGSNVADLATVARYDAATEEFVLTTPNARDRKDWIGNAARHGELATVFAQLEVAGETHGVHAFLVPIRDSAGRPARGVTIEDCGHKEGLNGVDNGRLSFDAVRVPRANLLDRFAQVSVAGEYSSPIVSPSRRFFTMLGTLVGGRVSVAGAALSAAKSGLAIALRYAARRRQFGLAGEAETVLLDYRAHQRRLLPRLAATYAIDFGHKYLVRRFLARGEADAREVETLAAGLKAYASWHATDTLQTCREACGGQGYLTVNRIPVLRDDTDVFTTFEGDNTVLMQLVAKGMLTEYRHQFTDLRLGGLLKVLASRAAATIGDFHLLEARRRGEDHLRGAEFLLDAFRHREEQLLISAARRLKARIDRGLDSFTAFNECQPHLLALANAGVERWVLEQFVEGVGAVDDAGVRAVLEPLCSLFGLWRLYRDRGWFLEHGMIEGAKAKAIRKQVTRLCLELRPHALPLVDAFGIPDELLAAPIAFAEAPGLGD